MKTVIFRGFFFFLEKKGFMFMFELNDSKHQVRNNQMKNVYEKKKEHRREKRYFNSLGTILIHHKRGVWSDSLTHLEEKSASSSVW